MKGVILSLATVAASNSSTLAAPVAPPCPEELAAATKAAASTPAIEFQHAMGNLSYLLGWTMAGSALNDDELDATCNNINSTSHGKWADEGINQTYVQETICNATHANPNATAAVPWVIYYSTELFVTQLLHAFAPNDTDALGYLCTNLDFSVIDNFRLRSTRVINATCTAAGTNLPPRPVTPAVAGVEVNSDAPQAFINTISTLYALLFASSATSDSQLSRYCAHAPEYVDSLNTMLLNGTVVQNTICDVKEPLSVDDAIAAFQTWSSRAFATIIESVSGTDGYLSWLTSNLNVNAMNAVGLNGQAVLDRVKRDARSS